jgi:DNA-binding Lrp family transcriptional regulator
LETIAGNLGVPKSTIHYRIHRLEQAGVIEHYFAKLNATKHPSSHTYVWDGLCFD